MFSKRKIEAFNKRPIIEKQEIPKENIYSLFKNDTFLEKITLIIRDFLITTWKMESESHTNQLRNKIFIEPINELILSYFDSSFIKDKKAITRITNPILVPFFNAKNNNKLYEAIIYKWWSVNTYKDSCENTLLATTLYDITLKNILRLDISREQKAILLKQNIAAKVDFLTQVTNKNISYFLDSSFSGFIKQTIKYVLFLVMLGVVFNFSMDNLNLLIAATVTLTALCFIMFTYSKNMRKRNWENTELTDYFIVDTLLEALENHLDEQSIPAPTINRCKPKKPLPLVQNDEKKFTDCNAFIDSVPNDIVKNKRIIIKQELHKKCQDHKDKMMMKFIHRPNQQTITWQGKDDHQNHFKYLFKPLKIRSVIIELWSQDQYLTQFCKHNFILCESATMKTMIKDKVQRSEFKNILRNGAVVKSTNCRGLVRIEDSLKAKTLKTGLSHYRLFCTIKSHTTIIENGREETKVLHAPVKYCNK